MTQFDGMKNSPSPLLVINIDIKQNCLIKPMPYGDLVITDSGHGLLPGTSANQAIT